MADWYTISPVSGLKNGSVTIVVNPNGTGDKRESSFIVRSTNSPLKYQLEASFKILQETYPDYTFNISSLLEYRDGAYVVADEPISGEAGVYYLIVDTDCPQDYITIADLSNCDCEYVGRVDSEFGDRLYRVTVGSNMEADTRDCSVTFGFTIPKAEETASFRQFGDAKPITLSTEHSSTVSFLGEEFVVSVDCEGAWVLTSDNPDVEFKSVDGNVWGDSVYGKGNADILVRVKRNSVESIKQFSISGHSGPFNDSLEFEQEAKQYLILYYKTTDGQIDYNVEGAYRTGDTSSTYTWDHRYEDPIINVYENGQGMVKYPYEATAISLWPSGDTRLLSIDGVSKPVKVFSEPAGDEFHSNNCGLYDMFDGCTSLKSVDMTNFDYNNLGTYNMSMSSTVMVSKKLQVQRMFRDCISLESVIFPDKFQAYDMQQMFYNCTSLTSLDISKIDCVYIYHQEAMLYGCKNLNSIKIGLATVSHWGWGGPWVSKPIGTIPPPSLSEHQLTGTIYLPNEAREQENYQSDYEWRPWVQEDWDLYTRMVPEPNWNFVYY